MTGTSQRHALGYSKLFPRQQLGEMAFFYYVRIDSGVEDVNLGPYRPLVADGWHPDVI